MRLILLMLIVGPTVLYGFTDGDKPTNAAAQAGTHESSATQKLVKRHSSHGRSLAFIENRGQFDSDVKFRAQSGNKVLWFTSAGVTFDVFRPGPGSLPAVSDLLPAGFQERNGSRANLTGEKFERLVFSEKFANSGKRPEIEASAARPGIYNYFVGNDPQKWCTGVAGYSQLLYHNVWPGVDVRFVANGSDVEQEFLVHPGADPSIIRIAYAGVEGLQAPNDGSLVVQTKFGPLNESSPKIYQEANGRRSSVPGRFLISSRTAYTFQLGSYNSHRLVVIDPTLLFSTYIGAGGIDNGKGIAVDAAGNTYIAGSTAGPPSSTPYPTTPGAFQTESPDSYNCGAVVSKFDPIGNLVYSTYLASTSECDNARGIGVDASGEAYITGVGYSGFPTTANALQQSCEASSFMSKLNSTGTGLLYSTCLGSEGYGAEYGAGANAIAIDTGGRAYITGSTGDPGFPVTSNAFQSSLTDGASAFVSVIDPSLPGSASLVYSTHLGGEVQDFGNAIAVDLYGSAYITGYTWSSHFPITPHAFQPTDNQSYCLQDPESGFEPQCTTGFVTKLNPNVAGKAGLIYSSYLGGNIATHPQGVDGSGDYPSSIAVDASGNAYVGGSTTSVNFPTTQDAFQPTSTCGGEEAGFVTKVNPGGSSLTYSTFIRPTDLYVTCTTNITSLALDSSGNAYVVGATGSGFPVTADAFQKVPQGRSLDAFLTELSSSGSDLVYSSYLSGSGSDAASGVAVDAANDVYLVGNTSSYDFPVTPFAFQPTLASDPSCLRPGVSCQDMFVTKFPLGASGGLSITGIEPNYGGNIGTVSPEVIGTGFHAGLTVQLECDDHAISGTSVSINAGGRLLATNLPLRGAPAGSCDVMVTNPDGKTARLARSFTIQDGGAAVIRITEVAGPAIRTPDGPPTYVTQFVAVSNIGSIDAPGGYLSELFDPYSSLVTSSSSASPPVPFLNLQVSPTTTVGTPGALFPIDSIPAGGQVGRIFTTKLSVTAPADSTLTESSCYVTDWAGVAACIASNPEVVATCIDAVKPCLEALHSCVGDELFSRECFADCFECLMEVVDCTARARPVVQQCIEDNSFPSDDRRDCGYLPVYVYGFPVDPNELIGPLGQGSQHWLNQADALSYAVSYTNKSSATAPAQQVTLTLPLDQKIDPGSLRLAGFTIPSVGTMPILVSIPQGSIVPSIGLNEFATNVDLRPAKALLVRVEAKFDPLTATLTWILTSLDPLTGLPPTNPGIGYLQPGATGSVFLIARPRGGLATSSQVSAKAAVVFNSLPPIDTDSWSNAIDSTSPESHVSPLPSTESNSRFAVAWSGTDFGSGVQSFTIYVSDDGMPFKPWLTNTMVTRSTYAGTLGHTYRFYSIATDLVGNTEALKTIGEANTTVQASPRCATDVSSQVAIKPGGFRYNHATKSFVQTVSLTNNGASLTDASLVLDNLSAAATLDGAGGTTLCAAPLGSPWISLPEMASGQSVSITLTFTDPTQAGIQYSTRVLAGNGQQ